MRRSLVLVNLLTLAVLTSNAQTVKAPGTCEKPSEGTTEFKCTYQIKFSELPDSTKSLSFELPMLDVASWRFKPDPKTKAKKFEPKVVGTSVQWVFGDVTLETVNSKKEWSITLQVTASKNRAKIGTSTWKARVDSLGDHNEKESALVALYDPSFVRPVLSAGGNFLLDDSVDFRVEKDPADETKEFLNTVNDSSLRASAQVGALFKIKSFRGPIKSLDFLAALDFTEDTQETLLIFA